MTKYLQELCDVHLRSPCMPRYSKLKILSIVSILADSCMLLIPPSLFQLPSSIFFIFNTFSVNLLALSHCSIFNFCVNAKQKHEIYIWSATVVCSRAYSWRHTRKDTSPGHRYRLRTRKVLILIPVRLHNIQHCLEFPLMKPPVKGIQCWSFYLFRHQCDPPVCTPTGEN